MDNQDQLAQLNQELLALRREALFQAENKLSAFCHLAWSILEPQTKLEWNWHNDLVCEYLECVANSEIKRLIINIPPKSMKSIIASVCFPAWVWIRKPNERFLCASYSQSLATKHSVDRRTILESRFYQSSWGDRYAFSSDQNVKTEFANSKRGHMIATSMHGTATGKGCSFLIVDDPHDARKAQSKNIREADIDAFDKKLINRLDDKKHDRIVVIMQRLDTGDLTEHLTSKGGWTHLSIPAIAEKEERIVFPVSKTVAIRETGNILHEAREPKAVLDQLRRDMGSQDFISQYQQRPTNPAGSIIKKEWLRYYSALPDRFDTVADSWDCAFKGNDDSDFVAGSKWGRRGANVYLLALVRRRLNFPSTMREIIALRNVQPQPAYTLIEDAANGPAVIQSLQNKIPGIIPFNPKSSKMARLNSVAPLFEAGNVWLPERAPWLEDYVAELCGFPNMPNDDQVDTTTQALLKLYDRGVAQFSEQMLIRDDIDSVVGSLSGDVW